MRVMGVTGAAQAGEAAETTEVRNMLETVEGTWVVVVWGMALEGWNV